MRDQVSATGENATNFVKSRKKCKGEANVPILHVPILDIDVAAFFFL